MTPLEKCVSSEAYYATLLHELSHWTGKSQGRDLSGKFGSEKYAFEELIAEFTSILLCNKFGIDSTAQMQNSVEYFANWAKALDKNPKILKSAMSQAQKAYSYLLSLTGIE